MSSPHENFVLGRYLGPSFDIGPDMTAKILKKNGDYVHRSTYRSLTDDELDDPLEINKRQQFDTTIYQKLSPGAKPNDTSVVVVDAKIPHYLAYEDNLDGGLSSA